MTNQLKEPKSLDEFFALPVELQEQWIAFVGAITSMRSDAASLAKTSRQFGIDPSTVERLGKSVLRKDSKGRYVVAPNDQFLRVVVVPSTEGLREIALTDSREASRLGEYWAAVQRYQEIGDASVRLDFEGQNITDASGQTIPLLTDLEDLDRLGSAGVLSFETIYARS